VAVNGSAVVAAPTSAVDPVVAEAIAMRDRLVPLKNALGIAELNDQEMDLFAMVALRMRLDPFAKQIYAIKRQGKVTFQTGIDGFRSSAEETDQYRGSDEPEFGPMVDKPFPHPEWARVIVHRELPDGGRIAQSATAWWDEFYPGDGAQGFQWKKMPRVMLAKCAEAAAFRKAFPRRFGGVYISEEMQQADAADQATPVSAPSQRDRVAAQRAEIEARTTSAPAAGSAAPVAVQGAEAPQPPTSAPAAQPSPAAAATGAGEVLADPGTGEVIEGEAVEVTEAAPLNPGELRDWLRGKLIGITAARERAMKLWRVDSLDRLTDEQRGALAADLEADPPA
jgi:phage recombination protein Bet